MEPVAVNEWMALGRNDLDVFHADAAQFVRDKVGGLLDVRRVLFEGAYAGNAEKIFEFVQEALLIVAGKINCGRGHDESFLRCAGINPAENARLRVWSEETNQYSATGNGAVARECSAPISESVRARMELSRADIPYP